MTSWLLARDKEGRKTLLLTCHWYNTEGGPRPIPQRERATRQRGPLFVLPRLRPSIAAAPKGRETANDSGVASPGDGGSMGVCSEVGAAVELCSWNRR